MSINSINYKKNKMIFGELIDKHYKIKKDSIDKNTLMIISNNKKARKFKFYSYYKASW